MKIATNKIKNIMDKKGISTVELAFRMGVKESWIYAVLAGDQGKTFKSVERLAKALGVEELEIIE